VKRVLVASATFGALALLSAQTPAPDPILRAMHDELARSRQMSISGLEAPYYIAYGVDDQETFTVSATLGGLLVKRREHFRDPDVQVRVGDYKFDNTNFAGRGIGGTNYDLGRFPLENAYPVLRRYWWLETDSAYKSAVEQLSRKRAAIRNVNQTEELHDLAHAEPMHYVRDFRPLTIDESAWANRVRALSAVFAEYPEIKTSSVELESSTGGYYMVNTEGTEVKIPETVTVLRVRATAQSSDGMTTRDAVTFQALDAAHMPGDAELTRGVNTLAKNVVALAHAPKGEDYSGPVLFEGTAGAQVFAEVLGKNLTLTRRPVIEGGRGGSAISSELEGRIGSRILPDSYEVVDDPTQKEWRGKALFGSYEMDREGVAPKPLNIVKDGKLQTFLLTRQPVKGFEGSNGRARLPGAFGAHYASVSNLFVSSTETTPAAELKKKLIELIQQRNKPYGIIVRRMDFPSTAPFDEARRLIQASQGSAHPVSAPVLVFKVFPDGHEELVRGMRFRGLTARSLKDILATGDDAAAFEYMDNSAPFSLVGGASFSAEACVVAPSVIFDDLELRPVEEEQPKIPLVPAPDITK